MLLSLAVPAAHQHEWCWEAFWVWLGRNALQVQALVAAAALGLAVLIFLVYRRQAHIMDRQADIMDK